MLRQIIMPALLAIILLAAALGITFTLMARNMDAESIIHESKLLEAELATKQQYLEQHVETNAKWDLTYQKTIQSLDIEWFDATTGNLVDAFSEIDAVLLIQTGGRLLYSAYANDDESLSQRNYGHLVRTIQRNLTTRLNTTQTLRGYLSFDDGVYIIGASTVWPETDELIEQAMLERQRNILVILEKLDDPKLLTIEKKLELDTLRLANDVDQKVVHLALGSSGYLIWEPKTPGADFIASLAVPVALFTVSILLIFTLFWRRADRLVRLFQRTDQTKSIFLSAVGHELRTPLNGITSGIALMQKEKLPTAQKAYLDTIERSSRELAAKVTQILDYTRLETSELQLEPVYFDLRTVLEDVVDDIRLESRDFGPLLALHIPTNCPTKTIGDSKRIKQIATILLSEMLNIGSQGTISLALTVDKSDTTNTSFRLLASTTGIGSLLSPLVSETDLTRTQAGDGTVSWNLATARYLAEAMSGDLSIVTDPQGRQQIHIQFVLGSRTQPDLDVAQPSCDGRRALIVSDETGDHLVLAEYLSDIGFIVENAKDELAAIRILKDHERIKYLVFVSELVGMESGVAIARKIKKAVGKIEIDLVLMAYNPQACDTSMLQNLEVASLLPRPVTLGTLLQLVKGLYEPTSQPQGSLIQEGQNLSIKRTEKLLEDMSILIVEDNPVSLNLLCKIIAKWHCNVSSATDGDEAVKAAADNPFDCILMDYHMPRMNGASATSAIRELGLDVPIIVLSAASDQKDIDACMNAGATAFVAKPVATPILKKKILQVVADHNDAQFRQQQA